MLFIAHEASRSLARAPIPRTSEAKVASGLAGEMPQKRARPEA
jgi:hypothetical protein